MAKVTSKDRTYLAGCLRDGREAGNTKFAFLVGAGTSITAGIPGAQALIREINETPKYAIHLTGLSDEEKTSYAKCMAALSSNERRQLLKHYLDKAKVNWASLSLASLLKEGHIERLLTFNFDNVITRACGICGHYPAIYDFAVNPPVHFEFLSPGSIIHLHGQGAGLVMLNSQAETETHAKKLEALYGDTLENFNLVVIGYSGSADSSFEKLKSLCHGQNRIFWLGHGEEPEAHIRELCSQIPTCQYYGGVEADKFLIELAQELNCWPPTLFTSPDQHLINELKPVIPFPKEMPGDDILNRLRSKLERRIREEASKQYDFEKNLLSGRYDEIIAQQAKAKTDPEKDAVSWAYIMLANSLADQARLTGDQARFKEAFEKYRAALAIKPDRHEALYNWGNALSDLGEMTGDPELLKEAIEKYRAALAIEPDKHVALGNCGVALCILGKMTRNQKLFTEAIEKYSAALALKPDDYGALTNWGNALYTLGEMTGNPELVKEAIEKYRAALAIEPDKHVALGNWGATLIHLAMLTGDKSFIGEAIEKFEAALKLKPDDVLIKDALEDARRMIQ